MNKIWKTGDNLDANIDKSKSNITDERKIELLNSLIIDNHNLQLSSEASYKEFPNSDLASCTLRLAQNITQLRKIKHSLIED